MNKMKHFGLAVLTATTLLMVGCSNNDKIADLSQVQLEEIVKNLPGSDRDLFVQYMGRNKMEHELTSLLGTKAEKEALKPYDQVSVKEAIKIEKEGNYKKK